MWEYLTTASAYQLKVIAGQNEAVCPTCGMSLIDNYGLQFAMCPKCGDQNVENSGPVTLARPVKKASVVLLRKEGSGPVQRRYRCTACGHRWVSTANYACPECGDPYTETY